MKRWLFAVLAALMLCLFPARCFAQEERPVLSWEEWEYYLNDDETATVSRWHGEGAIINVPEEINGVPVTGIGAETFSLCYKITDIAIPASVREIGAGAFSGCNSLTDIKVSPQNENFAVEDKVLFEKKTNTLVTYPGGLTGSSYSVPKGTSRIGDYAFMYCGDLTSVKIPKSVTEIGEGAFFSCSSLTEVKIPNSVTKIGAEAFYGCYHLSEVEIPKSVTEIGKHTFEHCSGLKAVTIPDSVTEIGDYAFMFCSGLTQIRIPASVTKIGERAFCSCGFDSVSIPASVAKIGEWAFGNCHDLTIIEVSPDNENYTVMDNALVEKKTKTLICYPDGLTDKKYDIPQGIAKIGDYAFLYCTKLTGITFPDSVTEIGGHALSSCSGLTSIEIPGSVTKIGERAFSNCAGLTDITIPASVTEIGKNAFEGCGKVTLTVEKGSYAEQYAEENKILYVYH